MINTKIAIIALSIFSGAATVTAVTVPIVLVNRPVEKEKQTVKKIVLDKTYSSLKVGETLQLSAKIEETSNTSFTWSSDDVNVATVTSNGLVKGIKLGTTKIRVFSDSIFASCTINVKEEVVVDDVKFEYSKLKIFEGDTDFFKIPYTCSSTRELEFTVSNPSLLGYYEDSKEFKLRSEAKPGDKIIVSEKNSVNSKCVIEVIENKQYISFAYKLDVNECSAFQINNNIDELEIPSISKGYFVTSFQKSWNTSAAFYNQNNLKKIIIPETIVSMKDAFSSCGFSLPDNEYIDVVFEDNSNLKEVNFKKCNIKSITLPSSVETISISGFSECDNLSEIKFTPNDKGKYNLKEIKEYAFSNCKSLESITLPEGLLSLDCGSFADCTELKKINLPSTLVNFGQSTNEYGAFHNCHNLNEVYIDSENAIKGSNRIDTIFDLDIIYVNKSIDVSEKESIYTPSYFLNRYTQSEESKDNYDIYTIKECYPNYFYGLKIADQEACEVAYGNAFNELAPIMCKQAYDFTPQTEYGLLDIKKISNNGFKKVSNLFYIKFASTVEEIGTSAFEDCDNLHNVVLNEGLTTIGSYAFKLTAEYRTKGLRYINIPSTVTSIGTDAFINCKYLDEVKIDSPTIANLENNDSKLLSSVSKIKLNKNIVLSEDSYINKNYHIDTRKEETNHYVYVSNNQSN